MKPPSQKAKPKAVVPADWKWANPARLKVDPAFQQLIPLQSQGEYRALEQSIKAEGCRDPLLVWKGRDVLLDGHTRRDLCIEHKKKVKVREIELADEKAATEFILQIQRQRRNLTREAASYFRGAEYNAIKGKRGGRRAKGQTVPLPSAARRLAEKYGVSDKTVKRDGVFARAIDQIVTEYGDPEVRRKLLGADVKLTQTLAIRLLRKPADERKDAVRQLVELGELPRSRKDATSSAPGAKEAAESIVARLEKKGEAHARSVLRQMARLLGMEVAEKSSDER
jgi:hypothetical protein